MYETHILGLLVPGTQNPKMFQKRKQKSFLGAFANLEILQKALP
jgi:hypothetical protein